MNTYRKNATITGASFIISNVVFIVGAVIFLESILGSPDYLTRVSANRAKLMLGDMLELLNAFAYLAIAVYMYPVLKRRFENWALGYVGFRVLEFVMQIIADFESAWSLEFKRGVCWRHRSRFNLD